MEENWLPIPIPGFSRYHVSSESNIRTPDGIIMKPSRTGRVSMVSTVGKISRSIYFLSCLAFHGPNPHPTYTVDHIDRDPKNNSIGNLRWASRELQVRNRNKFNSKGTRVMYTTSTNNILFKSITEAGRHFNIKHAKLGYMMKKHGFVKVPGGILKRHELLPEKDSIIRNIPSWILHDNKTKYKASSCGLVFFEKKWSTGTPLGRDGDYLTVGVRGKNYQVHRLIAAAFLGKSNNSNQIHVNHIDGNGLNNNINNLEWSSPSENSRHAVSAGLFKVQPIVQYNLDGSRVAEFTSITDAARSIGGNNSNIGEACRNCKPSAYKFMWRYKSEAPEQLPPFLKKCTPTEIRQYDLDGNLMATFPSIKGAAKFLGVSVHKINSCCQGRISLGNFTLDNK